MRVPKLSSAVIFLAVFSLISGCSSKKEEKISSEQKLYEKAQLALNASNWDSAIKALQLIEEHYPFGSYGEQSQLEIIYAHYEADQFDEAIAAADRFIRLHPQHRNTDYAYYMRGMASFNKERSFLSSLLSIDNTNRDPGAAKDSLAQFTDFLTRYPKSPYAPDAQKRMVYLRNVLARYEIHVANYYFKRGAYLAAANRGRYVVENFQTTPAVPDALAVMAQAYFLLKRDDLAENTVKVLASNFPDHPALDKSGQFDRSYTYHYKKNDWLKYATLGLLSKEETQGFDSQDIYNKQDVKQPPNL
ncbi:MAG TPA: outer membrane protein assembly factor BamD [Cellvibrionaceae bacterium]|nr:outer membrane protein assembly factor BamD [Cellvibrionaceae bacterium]